MTESVSYRSCPQCNTKQDARKAFCVQCGYAFADSDASSSVAPATQGREAKQTMFGLPAISHADLAKAKAAETEPSSSIPTESDNETSDVSLTPPPASSSSSVSWVGGTVDNLQRLIGSPLGKRLITRNKVLTFAAIIAVTATGLWWLCCNDSALTLRLEQNQQGEQLVLREASIPTNSLISFHHQKRRWQGNAIRFSLLGYPLKLGTNEVVLTITEPGDTKPEKVESDIEVNFLIRPDIDAFINEPSKLKLHIYAPASASVEVEGKQVKLNEEGEGELWYPVKDQIAPDARQFRKMLNYRVRGLPSPKSGNVSVVIPLAHITLAEPGTQVVTEESSIRLSGTTLKGSQMTLDGREIAVTEKGNFAQTVDLKETGTHAFLLRSARRGTVPATLKVYIQRVSSIKREARRFGASKHLKYKKIAERPKHYMGRKVAYTGDVYHIKNKNAGCIAQILVDKCDRHQRCPLWLTIPQRIENIKVGDTIQAYGVFDGMQQFRTESGKVMSVPRLQTRYVIPAK